MRPLAALGAAVILALAGCSADDPRPTTLPPLASGSPSGSGTPFSAAPKAPAGATAPARVTSQQLPSVPAEAVAETPLAASAFTKFFFEQVNEAYAHGDSSRVLRLSAPQCNSCKSIAEDVDRLSRAGLKVPGRRFVLDYAEAAPPDNPGSIFVDFRFSSDPYVEHAASGAAATSAPAAEGQVGQARLIRSGPGWLMSGLRLVSS